MFARWRRGHDLSLVVELVLERLIEQPEGCSKQELVTRIGRTSEPTVQRALTILRDEHGAPIVFDARTRRWVLQDSSFRLPTLAPELDDVRAVLVAEAMLEPIADGDLRQRLRCLAEQLDDRIRTRTSRTKGYVGGAVKGRATLGTRVDLRQLYTLLVANRRQPIRIIYDKPWENQRVRHTVEPWGICVFDGAIYFKGFVRECRGPRTFRLAQVDSLLACPGERFRHPLPPIDRVWDGDAPAFGIDHDRPNIAVLRLRGGVARWVHRTIWHPDQRDCWLDEPELLERRVPYRSCREIARRISSVLDGVESIEPPELRAQVDTMIASYQSRNPSPQLRAAVLARTKPRRATRSARSTAKTKRRKNRA